MKIKRFFAADIRQALRQVRETLGSDAVILSNKRVDGGVELVAAMDYDESAFQPVRSPRAVVEPAGTAAEDPMTESRSAAEQDAPEAEPGQSIGTSPAHPSRRSPRVEWVQEPALVEMRQEMQALRRLVENQLSGLGWREMAISKPLQQDLYRRLMGLDLSSDICDKLVRLVGDCESLDQAWRRALYFLSGEVEVVGDRLIEQGGMLALVGPTGVGKTTTIAKLAARFTLKYGNRQLGLISTDSYRIGAQEQLNTYARILDVPIRAASNAEELRVAFNAFADKRLVLIDTAGMSQRDIRLGEQLALLEAGNQKVKCLLTLSATTQRLALEQAIRAFGGSSPEGCILTKVDEAGALGGALSALIHSGLPLAFLTDGQKVPEDLHLARPHTLVSRAAALGEQFSEHHSDEYLALTLGEMRADAHG